MTHALCTNLDRGHSFCLYSPNALSNSNLWKPSQDRFRFYILQKPHSPMQLTSLPISHNDAWITQNTISEVLKVALLQMKIHFQKLCISIYTIASRLEASHKTVKCLDILLHYEHISFKIIPFVNV